jgi:uncharacterized protein
MSMPHHASDKARFRRAPIVAVAGLSVRMIVQSAARAGFNVLALDTFGDRDTRQCAWLWFDVGDATHTAVDRTALLDALTRAARLPDMVGFIVGSGLEPLCDDLYDTPGLPPLLGNSAQSSAAVRDPRRFFALLDELGVAHPPVSFTCPANPAGWLLKRAHGCGGTHVEWAAQGRAAPFPSDAYFQQLRPGQPMSALFVGARREVAVIGFATQLTCRVGHLPFVHAGSLGPIELPSAVASGLCDAIGAIVARTGLTGVNSIDFLLDGESFYVLEINARPSATMALYEMAWPEALPRGVMGCHLDACLHGRLPEAPLFSSVRVAPSAAAGHPGSNSRYAVPGGAYGDLTHRAAQRVVFAPYGFTVSEAFSNICYADPGCHDVPQPGTLIQAWQPVCTLTARASSIHAAQQTLEDNYVRLLQRIETCHEHCHDALLS